MKYKQRSYPEFSACGLNCGLCPRYYTKGSSRCPGCAGEGFSDVHPTCGILSCCQRKKIEYCFECDEYPCKKYDGIDSTDSFITHRNQLTDMERAKKIGIEAYKAELDEKMRLLKILLDNYNDGKRTSFICLAVNLFELEDTQRLVKFITDNFGNDIPIKDRAKIIVEIFTNHAYICGISLKLRK